MIIIGEKLNTSIEKINAAVKDGDAEIIGDIALAQAKAGADYIDVNCGTFVDDEAQRLKWMVRIVKERVDKPLCIDSPNPHAIAAALEVHGGGKPIINSITAQRDRYQSILPLIIEYETSIIALPMDDKGIPASVEGKVSVATELVNSLVRDGVPYKDILVDPMIQPLATLESSGQQALKTLVSLKESLPDINTVCGLSNISYGLPHRSSINKAFLVLAIHKSLDAAILDPLDSDIMPLVHAAQLLLGEDEYCLNYIESIRGLNRG